MVNHKIDGHQRIDEAYIAAPPCDFRSHRGEINDGRDAGEVLQQDARRHESTLFVGSDRLAVPFRQRLDVVGVDVALVGVAQQIFQQYLDGDRQVADIRDTTVGQSGEAVVVDSVVK